VQITCRENSEQKQGALLGLFLNTKSPDTAKRDLARGTSAMTCDSGGEHPLTATRGLPDAHVTGKNLTPKSKMRSGPGPPGRHSRRHWHHDARAVTQPRRGPKVTNRRAVLDLTATSRAAEFKRVPLLIYQGSLTRGTCKNRGGDANAYMLGDQPEY
jgi:hypothetical protein